MRRRLSTSNAILLLKIFNLITLKVVGVLFLKPLFFALSDFQKNLEKEAKSVLTGTEKASKADAIVSQRADEIIAEHNNR